MSVVEFVPKEPLKPLFAIKLAPFFFRIHSGLSFDQFEKIVKEALNIDENRLLDFHSAEDKLGNRYLMMIIFNYKYRHKKPSINLPEKDGFFDFDIFDVDFNMDIDIEEIIKKI